MSKIAVASLNSFKIKAIRDAFLNYFDEIEVKEIQVNIDTPNQTIRLDTFKGADLRAQYLSKKELFQELF
jgi:non-canonical (house-cleaning) NTP pyrophosphatase